MIYDAKHIKAARQFVEWSQHELSIRSGVSPSTIKNIEAGSTSLRDTQADTLPKIEEAFTKEGIRFTPIGVEQPPISHFKVKEFYGKNWWRDIVENVLDTIVKIDDKTIYLFNSTPSESPEHIIILWNAIERAGGEVRSFIEEGNTYYRGAQKDYRWTPKDIFKKNTLTMVYGDNVVITFEENKGGVIINSPDLADDKRRLYQHLWKKWDMPEPSTYKPS